MGLSHSASLVPINLARSKSRVEEIVVICGELDTAAGASTDTRSCCQPADSPRQLVEVERRVFVLFLANVCNVMWTLFFFYKIYQCGNVRVLLADL